MQELIVFTGNIGTGKSLAASKYAKNGYVVVNMDSITTMVQGGEYGLYDSAKKSVYHGIEKAAICTALGAGFSVVVDRTNMKKSDRARYIEMATFPGIKKVSIDWGMGNEKSINRRLKNPNGVPDLQWIGVHEYMAKSYERPSVDEGFDELLRGPKFFYFRAMDFDGTICENEFPAVGKPIEPMIEMMREWWKDNSNIIIIWTCRSGNVLNEMKKWLLDNKVPFDFINENPMVAYGSPKIFANEYWDDRSAGCPKPQGEWP